MTSHVCLESLPLTSTAIISKSSSTHSSEQVKLCLTQINTPPPRVCLSLLKVVKSALNISVLPISSLSHDSVPIIMSGLYYQLNSKTLRLYCKYFCNLLAIKPVTYPQIYTPVP